MNRVIVFVQRDASRNVIGMIQPGANDHFNFRMVYSIARGGIRREDGETVEIIAMNA